MIIKHDNLRGLDFACLPKTINPTLKILVGAVFMKIFTTTFCLFSVVFSSVAAAMPTKIIFISQDRTNNGDTYYIYQVECSDGRHPTISSWSDNKKWCLGTNSSQCETTRLKAATAVCKNS
jgi:hypothetical protein